AAAALLALGLHSAPAAADRVVVSPDGVYVKTHHDMHRVDYSRRVSIREARATALARMPNMKLRSESFTRVDGRPAYVFTLFNAQRRGLTQVTVDARSGAVINVQHLGRY